jgi:hypothetical protein
MAGGIGTIPLADARTPPDASFDTLEPVEHFDPDLTHLRCLNELGFDRVPPLGTEACDRLESTVSAASQQSLGDGGVARARKAGMELGAARKAKPRLEQGWSE